MNAIQRLETFQLAGAVVPQLEVQMILPPVEADGLLNGLELLFVHIRLDESFEKVEKCRCPVNLGGLQALNGRTKVRKALQNEGTSLFDAPPQKGFDHLCSVDEWVIARNQLVHDLPEELGPAFQRFAGFRL
jgi:hypothetical protein